MLNSDDSSLMKQFGENTINHIVKTFNHDPDDQEKAILLFFKGVVNALADFGITVTVDISTGHKQFTIIYKD
jgi:hypothetical protein